MNTATLDHDHKWLSECCLVAEMIELPYICMRCLGETNMQCLECDTRKDKPNDYESPQEG